MYIFNEYKKLLLFPHQSTVTYLPPITYFNSKVTFVPINTEINVANKLQRKHADHPWTLPSLHFLCFLITQLPLHHFQLETFSIIFVIYVEIHNWVPVLWVSLVLIPGSVDTVTFWPELLLLTDKVLQFIDLWLPIRAGSWIPPPRRAEYFSLVSVRFDFANGARYCNIPQCLTQCPCRFPHSKLYVSGS